jgi:DNA-binding GntR family transcriptional regulator
MNSSDLALGDEQPLHSTVYRLVRDNIESGRLPPGTVITEYRLANQFALSREPVGRALRRLEAEGLIVRDQTRGYSVSGAPGVPSRQQPPLDISDATLELFRGRAEWRKIWERVQGDLIACMPFGRYKIIEMTMATHYGVSRTVTRDLLARLETLNLVEREGRSQCYLRQLTPALMTELYELRCLLEPPALIKAAPLHRKENLERMRDDLLGAERRYPDVGPEDLARYEEDLHVVSTDDCPNRTLVESVRQSQMLVLATNRLIPLYLGMPRSEPFFAEHRLVIELLLNEAPEAAAVALEAHLKSAVRKQHARLSELRAHSPLVLPYLVTTTSADR